MGGRQMEQILLLKNVGKQTMKQKAVNMQHSWNVINVVTTATSQGNANRNRD